jgi:hypothetical protein
MILTRYEMRDNILVCVCVCVCILHLSFKIRIHSLAYSIVLMLFACFDDASFPLIHICKQWPTFLSDICLILGPY